jgi:hypothetical protein
MPLEHAQHIIDDQHLPVAILSAPMLW